jgi:large subunit ribosomal protein L3
MLNTIFATKKEMSQAWSKQGKRIPVTKLEVSDNIVLSVKEAVASAKHDDTIKKSKMAIFEIGYGDKKLKNMSKPLREQVAKGGFSVGVKQIKGVQFPLQDEAKIEDLDLKVGQTLKISYVLEVGDVIEVQGQSKGRGFAGAMKRHGFHGGPKTHGQSDRSRAVGSIGSGTDPGRVWKGKKMPGRYGNETKTVSGLVIVYIDEVNNEIWVNGPVPGFKTSIVRITKTGEKKNIELNLDVLGLNKVEEKVEAPVEEAAPEAETPVEAQAEVKEEKAEAKEAEAKEETK